MMRGGPWATLKFKGERKLRPSFGAKPGTAARGFRVTHRPFVFIEGGPMKLHGITLAALLALQAGTASAAEEKASPGKALFVSSKCAACHTIATEGVEKSKAADAEAAAEAKPEEGASKKGPPDLSGVGLRHDAAWLGKYLLKLEAKDGKKHLKKFRGTDEELGVLTAWLAGLKKEAAKKDAPAGDEKKPDAAPSEKEGEKKAPTPEGDTSKS